MADLDWRCDCGTVRGTLTEVAPATALLAVCYCADCQTFARHLDRADILDPNGGSTVVQTIQSRITFTAGADQLACLRLSPRGTLRWYATCCKTPIANMMPNPKMAFAGMSARLFQGAAATHLAPAVGVNGKGAVGDRSTLDAHDGMPVGLLAKAGVRLLWDRLRGAATPDPFRTAGGDPIAEPQVLTLEQRDAARPA